MATKKKTTGKPMQKEVKVTSKFLADVASDRCFWVNNGWIVRNLRELPLALKNMTDAVFAYHVNNHKNDFYSWVKDVVGDQVLANDIRSLKKKELMLAKVEKRVAQLK